MTTTDWQLIYEIWDKNKDNLIGISIQASLHKDKIASIKQFTHSLIAEYKTNPKGVRKAVGVDLKPYVL